MIEDFTHQDIPSPEAEYLALESINENLIILQSSLEKVKLPTLN